MSDREKISQNYYKVRKMYDMIIFMAVFYAVSRIVNKMNKNIKPLHGIYISMAMAGLVSMGAACVQMLTMQERSSLFYWVLLSLSLLISVITWVSFIIMLRKRVDPVIAKPVRSSPLYCWTWFGLASLMMAISIYFFRFSIYSPSFFHSSLPVPSYGVSIYIAGLFSSCFFLYLNAGCKNVDQPEFHYWLTICVLMYLICNVALKFLILNYGMKFKYGTGYPYHAGILMVSLMPIVVCLISLAYKKSECAERKA